MTIPKKKYITVRMTIEEARLAGCAIEATLKFINERSEPIRQFSHNRNLQLAGVTALLGHAIDKAEKD